MRIIKRIVLITGFFVYPLVIFCQAKFYTVVSEKHPAFNQTFQVQYIIEGAKSIQRFIVPNFADFQVEDVFEIPNTPTINPQTLQLVDAYSRIAVLSPKKRGSFLIPGASAIIDGKRMRSNGVSVSIGENDLTNSGVESFGEYEVQDESELEPGENIGEKIRNNFFLKTDVTKTSCYVGEPLMAVYKACSRLNANSQVVKRPSLSGFSVLEMVDAYDQHAQIEKIKGKPFYVHLIRKVQLFPLLAGTFELDAAEVQSVIHFVQRGSANKNNLPGSLEREDGSISMPLEHTVSVKSEPLIITVKPLPEADQPDNFSGAVGNFAIASRLMEAKVQQGDLIKMQVVISGNGNLPLINAPVIEWPAGIEASAPAVREELNKYLFPLSGSKIFEFSFPANQSGTYVLPPVSFSYFDPAQKKYQTTRSNAITYEVTGVSRRKQLINKLVDPNFQTIPRHFYWFGLIVMAIVSWIIYQGLQLRKSNSRKSTEIKKIPGTETILKIDPLDDAKNNLYATNPKEFYLQIQRAVWHAVSARWNILPSKLNKSQVEEILKAVDAGKECIADFNSILDECEWALYTPDDSIADRQIILQKTKRLIEKIKMC